MPRELTKRLPLYSMLSGATVAAGLMFFSLSQIPLPRVGMAAFGFLPLAAAVVDAVRLVGKHSTRGADPKNRAGQGGHESAVLDQSQLQEWLTQQTADLSQREQELNARSLALQQWMQFPDVIDFDPNNAAAEPIASTPEEQIAPAIQTEDPLANHDRELLRLIESKTHELFENIKQDAYRKASANGKSFDNARIRSDVIALVSDVAAIYRPGETSPLLKTNVEATSRAIGRASLRLLVAVENLPGGLAGYDFQSIYTVVIRAVKTFGMYQSAKPYLDVASGFLLAGRVVSATNPLTMVAWWAASKATTYGASRLGTHVLDQQAVGLIRQLVEIVAIEVASIYSPMVRYRDIHWIYGVELVHLISQLNGSDAACVEAMKQIAALNLRDEYGRVSLMRHLASRTSLRPANYRPAESLSAADRKLIAEQLESFLTSFIIGDRQGQTRKDAIQDWQQQVSARLEIQLRGFDEDVSTNEQSIRCIWSLAAFSIQYLGDEPHEAVKRIRNTYCWNAIDPETQREQGRAIQENPPYLYHPPAITPETPLCDHFVDDLIKLACAANKTPKPSTDQPLQTGQHFDLPPWDGEQALRMTAYSLRCEVDETIEQLEASQCQQLLPHANRPSVPEPIARILSHFQSVLGSHHPSDTTLRFIYLDGQRESEPQGTAHVARFGETLLSFTTQTTAANHVQCELIGICAWKNATIEKVPGYVRSDCRITFDSGLVISLQGSTLGSYDSTFAGLTFPG